MLCLRLTNAKIVGTFKNSHNFRIKVYIKKTCRPKKNFTSEFNDR